MPYINEQGNVLLGNKCYGCKFCYWDSERHEYSCEAFGCYEYSNYSEFVLNHPAKPRKN